MLMLETRLSDAVLAARLAGILPPLSAAEALEVSMIHSVSGLLSDGGLLRQRAAFRDPHHSASLPALVGGGTRASRGKYPWRTRACCSWTSCPSSPELCSCGD